MMEPIEQLPARMNRRNWLILGVLLTGSLAFRNWSVTLGILCGGLVAVGGFYWLHRSLHRLMTQPAVGSRAGYQFGYLVRLMCLAAVLGLLVGVAKIDPVGLVIGLSVVIVNILLITIQRAFWS